VATSRTTRIGIAQWLAEPGKPEANLDAAVDRIRELGHRRCDVIVLPEYWAAGFSWDTLASDVAAAAEPVPGPRTHRLADEARRAGAWLCAGTVPERTPEATYNSAPLFDREGRLVALHRKMHLYTPLKEDTAVAAGDGTTVAGTKELGRVGVSICFDGDFPEVARAMRRAGARIVLHPSAYETEATTWWETLYPANALANGQWWIMANQAGTNSSGTLLGGSRVISPFGEVVASAVVIGPGENAEPELLVVDVSLEDQADRAERENGVLWEDA
jgi:predicted amidohydrolase